MSEFEQRYPERCQNPHAKSGEELSLEMLAVDQGKRIAELQENVDRHHTALAAAQENLSEAYVKIAELEKQLAEATEWRPIETALKDGTEIDLWFEGGYRIADCAWSGAGWYSDAVIDKFGHMKELKDPTHWMLPPAKDTT